MEILYEIAANTKKRLTKVKKELPLDALKEQAAKIETNKNYPFLTALKKKDLSFICEVKKASPSKGLIAEHFPYVDIARDYELAGADAISCLTEPDYFLGSNQYLSEISKAVSIPVLKKDFIVDEYQIYEGKAAGAAAVLLICSLLEEETLQQFLNLTHELGMSALVEAHDEAEVQMALRSGAQIIGVNNRNLKTFQVDIHNSAKLRALVPKEVVFVAESGIQNAKDVQTLRENGTNAVLIGETLMRSSNKKQALDALKGGNIL